MRRGYSFVVLQNEEGAESSSGGFDMESAVDEISNDLFGTSEDADEQEELDERSQDDGEEKAAVPASKESGEPSGDKGEPADAEKQADQADKSTVVPKTWKPEAAAEWEKIPPVVQQEILRRESDIFRGIEQYKVAANFGTTVNQIISPYAESIRSRGGDALQHVQQLLEADKVLSSADNEQKVQYFLEIAKQYGVNFTADEVSFESETVKALRNELNEVKSHMTSQQQLVESERRTKVLSEITAFESDPANEHFQLVGNDMAVLLQSGAAKDLRDAYDKAVWANPVTRAKEIEKQQKEVEARIKAETLKQVEKAKKLTSFNTQSSGKRASKTTPQGSIDDTLQQAANEIYSRG